MLTDKVNLESIDTVIKLLDQYKTSVRLENKSDAQKEIVLSIRGLEYSFEELTGVKYR
ncbi:hypothetical protein HOV56_gp47 [Nitrosopumilus spindle-shaped virus]|uniref:Uncharacterized protein n=1 Tax=Nitrosopumilus spindle-shaped virus TaxID=2508184 RepID=A0A514K2S5_9VIRU|nr:hypothetical protein HOV56_gp47 [Nitrosopumilus spindle-shaped virus]YP_010772876.1 hypothetical protein QIT54_gp46 [Nitrosopumilus spindle-shaped virus]QDI73936.1 hypothetical protein [Nitrosopumilus spindle-shaped virus]QDI73984.1 hypothetical protein [Nitrosopumilus spindle-shaped virus]